MLVKVKLIDSFSEPMFGVKELNRLLSKKFCKPFEVTDVQLEFIKTSGYIEYEIVTNEEAEKQYKTVDPMTLIYQRYSASKVEMEEFEEEDEEDIKFSKELEEKLNQKRPENKVEILEE